MAVQSVIVNLNSISERSQTSNTQSSNGTYYEMRDTHHHCKLYTGNRAKPLALTYMKTVLTYLWP